MWEQFYFRNHKAESFYNFSDCILTPEVTVFREDTPEAGILPEEEWWKMDVITCAPPNLHYLVGNHGLNKTDEELYAIYVERIHRIFIAAVLSGADVLVLCAFGCGWKQNPQELVTKAFQEVEGQYRGYFETIEYTEAIGIEIQL